MTRCCRVVVLRTIFLSLLRANETRRNDISTGLVIWLLGPQHTFILLDWSGSVSLFNGASACDGWIVYEAAGTLSPSDVADK